MNFFRFGFVSAWDCRSSSRCWATVPPTDGATCAGAGAGSSRSPIMDPAIWAQLKDYNRPDFHPDDSDTTELVQAWRAELFGEHGTLNDKLIGAA